MSAGPERRAHRPTVRADLTALIDAAGGEPLVSAAERAASTAQALVTAGRARRGERAPDELVHLADIVGLETLAQLWRGADGVSLPGALWALYVLRQWCHEQPEQVVRLWRAGAPYAAADAVVAGVPDAPAADDLLRVVDAVLAGVFDGDAAVAFERAAAMFRVLATGRRETSDPIGPGPDEAPGPTPAGEYERAVRHDRVAADLTAAAARWRDGTLH